MNSHKVSLLVAILINVNIMIGAAIYIGPPQMAETAGAYSFLGWIFCAAVFLPVVLSINCLSRIYPGEAGLYLYARKTFGSSLGFLCGWLYFLGFVGAESLQSVVLIQALVKFSGYYQLIEYAWFFKAIFFLLIFLICQLSISRLGVIQSYITFAKLVPILFVLLTLFLTPFISSTQGIELTNLDTFSFTSIVQTIPFAIFGFWGFESSCNISGRIKGGNNQASKALLISFFLVTTIYALFHLQTLLVMGSDGLAQNKIDGFIVSLGWKNPIYIKMCLTILSVAIMVSYFNTILSEVTTYSFILQAMAKAKDVFMSKKVVLSNKNLQPTVAIGINCLMAYFMATFIPNEKELIAIANLGIVSSFVIVLSALVKIFYTRKQYFKILLPLIGYLSCLIIAYYSIDSIGKLSNIMPFFIFIILGGLLFLGEKKTSSG
jgi:amino acid transporter